MYSSFPWRVGNWDFETGIGGLGFVFVVFMSVKVLYCRFIDDSTNSSCEIGFQVSRLLD